MSEKKGKLVTCDRCENTVFLETIGDGELDGGFTRWNKFEEYPEGWEYSHDLSKRLCPECNKEYRELLENFEELRK